MAISIDLVKIYQKACKKKKLSFREAFFLINLPAQDLPQLLTYARKLREKFCGQQVELCSITNAKSGKCSENCSFCSQSVHHKTQIDIYPLLSKKELLNNVRLAKKAGAHNHSLVTSGRGIASEKELKQLCNTIAAYPKSIRRCASLGLLTKKELRALKKAGLQRFHHNLETAASFFNQICTTHTHRERIRTIKNARQAGLEICAGGIFGLGETPAQRVELALALRKLKPTVIPINIAQQIKGTRLAGQTKKLTVNEILKLIAVYRFVLPDKNIGVFAGRTQLGQAQHRIFEAGANGLMLGNYLTIKGQQINQDLCLVKKVELHL